MGWSPKIKKKVQINAFLEKSEKQTDEYMSSKQSKGYKV